MSKEIIATDNAPAAIGTYSQAVRVGKTVYLSGQIPLVPETMELVSNEIDEQIHQVFSNLAAVCHAAGATLDHVVKFNVYLTDLGNFPRVNAIMEEVLTGPYPARAAVQVSALPRDAQVEVDGVLELTA
jgi:reactive intermediate/imine deaminase